LRRVARYGFTLQQTRSTPDLPEKRPIARDTGTRDAEQRILPSSSPVCGGTRQPLSPPDIGRDRFCRLTVAESGPGQPGHALAGPFNSKRACPSAGEGTCPAEGAVRAPLEGGGTHPRSARARVHVLDHYGCVRRDDGERCDFGRWGNGPMRWHARCDNRDERSMVSSAGETLLGGSRPAREHGHVRTCSPRREPEVHPTVHRKCFQVARER